MGDFESETLRHDAHLFSRKFRGWGYIVLGVILPPIGFGLLELSQGSVWLIIPGILFIVPVAEIVLVLGIIILARKGPTAVAKERPTQSR